MKKIFTLLLALGSLTAVFAQEGYRGGYDHERNDYGRDSHRRREAQYYSYDHSNWGNRGYDNYERCEQRGWDKDLSQRRSTYYNPYSRYHRSDRDYSYYPGYRGY